jgi:hypothetical protein
MYGRGRVEFRKVVEVRDLKDVREQSFVSAMEDRDISTRFNVAVIRRP